MSKEWHFVSSRCKGEVCRCGNPATHKVGEEIPRDDPMYSKEGSLIQQLGRGRQNFTAYVCCACFREIMGDAVFCPEKEHIENPEEFAKLWMDSLGMTKVKVFYRRSKPKEGLERLAEAVNQATGGIVHLLRSDRWLSLDRVVMEARKYNIQFGEVAFETDPTALAQQLGCLIAVGLAEVTMKENVSQEIFTVISGREGDEMVFEEIRDAAELSGAKEFFAEWVT